MGPTTFQYAYLVKVGSSFFTTSPGGWQAGRADAGYTKNKTNLSLQAKLDLKLGLSLEIITKIVDTWFAATPTGSARTPLGPIISVQFEI